MIEGDEGGVVFLWAMAAWCWSPTDVASRRLAALQLVATRSASRAVCAGLQVLGNRFAGMDGKPHEGLGLLDCETTATTAPAGWAR